MAFLGCQAVKLLPGRYCEVHGNEFHWLRTSKCLHRRKVFVSVGESPYGTATGVSVQLVGAVPGRPKAICLLPAPVRPSYATGIRRFVVGSLDSLGAANQFAVNITSQLSPRQDSTV